MSRAQKSVIVIGSGIGGSAIGAMLSHRGYHVTVLERLNFIGGRCCTAQREGFAVDLGVHTFSQSGAGPLGEVLRQCGRSEDAVQWSYTKNPTQKLNYLGTTVEFPRGLGQIVEDVNNYADIMQKIVTMPPEEIEGLRHVAMKEWLGRHTSDPVIYSIFAYIWSILTATLSCWEMLNGQKIWK